MNEASITKYFLILQILVIENMCTKMLGSNRFSRNPNTLKFNCPGIGIHLDNWNRITFLSRFDGIGIYLFWDKWNLESNYYQEYEYISFFAPDSESNHPLGEMVTSPKMCRHKRPFFIESVQLMILKPINIISCTDFMENHLISCKGHLR